MLDARLRPLINLPLNAAGRWLARYKVEANAVSLGGVLVGVAAAAAIANGAFLAGLLLILCNRLLDGLDGAVARATRLTDFGGYLDIVGDFVFYVAIPVGFAFASPANQIPALLLVASFALTGASFLAFAALAAKRGLESAAHGPKSFFYNTGIAEGAETILVFVLMTLLPAHFATVAIVYTLLCLLTVLQRTYAAWNEFR